MLGNCYDNINKMAAPMLNKPVLQNVPRLQSTKGADMTGKLLRKPRAPKRIAKSPERNESKFSHNNNTFQLDELQPPPADYRPLESGGNHSPAPSRAYSLVSPPPPSEATHKKSLCYDYPEKRGGAFITKDDKKYVLDPIYREKTLTGGSRPHRTPTSQTPGLLRLTKGRGPDPLPPRLPRQNPDIIPDYIDYTDDARYYKPPDFTLENFLVDVSEVQEIPLMRVKRAVYSKHNYKKIIHLLKSKIHAQCEKVNKVNISAEDLNIPVRESRIPQRQLLIELAAVIKQHVRETMNADVKSIIRPLPKYTPHFSAGSAPHTEIVLYEDPAVERSEQVSQEKQANELASQDSVFPIPQSGYFQGAARSGSPFNTETVISPSEIAVLDSLVSGGTALSLKAHFIDILPDMSPMIQTITYLNLSFNNFTYIPLEITNMSQLEVLKLRNNPITEIPEEIHKLSNLRVLVASFCLINSLPDTLCQLKNLIHLNLSYNKLQMLPSNIGLMSGLRECSLEGNQLPALPKGALLLTNLKLLNVKNNFMHPLFWKDFTQDQPQQLVDITCQAIHKYKLNTNLENSPESLKTLLTNYRTCDCCEGPLFGPGMRIIRPVEKIFNIKYLPFMFLACSSRCKSEFMSKTAVLSDSLYQMHNKDCF